VERVVESTMSIANTPEEHWWQEVHKILLSHVCVNLILSKNLIKNKATLWNDNAENKEHYEP
jgi:hypothetical protein